MQLAKRHRYQKIMAKAYDELAFYLGEIPWPYKSPEKKKTRAAFNRSKMR